MIIANKHLCITGLIVAGSALVGCAQTPRQQNPWAGISPAPQQQPAYEGSYVDSNMDRQVNRQQSHVNSRVNHETDQAVDSVVERALDSIFE